MSKIDLSKYGITGVTEIVHNPSYDAAVRRRRPNRACKVSKKGNVTDMGAVNVMTGVYTGRSPKDKFFVMDAIPPRTRSGGLPTSTRTTTSPSARRAGKC